ncbi:hypothetical protein MED297_09436 [Reinekea sp. MED297]|uniref:Uncharacterized protein n=1 Tax=Reinekea blandensis MED297 TaxID=314283 RepID=A4BHU7_9GAMM|nr:hypothetical protein MED297_09436 [Reinekea sp. MED297] [Reinekea blandensis MED297]
MKGTSNKSEGTLRSLNGSVARFDSWIIDILYPAIDYDAHWAVQARPEGGAASRLSEKAPVVVPVFAKVPTFTANRA